MWHSGRRLSQQPTPAVMGPCFRRDDGDDCLVAFHTTVVVRLDRTIQYAAASRLFSDVYGILGRPVPSAPRLRRGMRSLWPAEALAKAASRAMTSESLARSHSSDTPLHSRGVNSPEPCFALSSVTTLFDTVACASSHRLDANDWGVGTTRLRRTQADRVRLARCRVHRIPPRVRDDREPPLHWDETVRISELICPRRQAKFLKIGNRPWDRRSGI